MSLVRNIIWYLKEDLTPTRWRQVEWVLAVMFTITMGTTAIYGLFDQQMLIATWFGIVAIACIFLGGFLYESSKRSAVAAYATWAIGLGSLLGGLVGMLIATLY